MTNLIDKHNRHLNYLRLSVTDRCNLRCMYCLPRGFVPKLSHTDILNYEEILRLVRLGVGLGISKVRVTGGEPLVRKGICDFLKQLSKIEGLLDISLTTNGVLLKDNIEEIRSAGIKRINISMDSLNRQKFKKITGQDSFDQVWEGIELAQKMGFDPIKINVVALRGINDDELTDIAKLSFSYPFHIRFIEYMPMGNAECGMQNAECEMLAPEIMERISVLGKLNPVENGINDGPADRYKFDGAKGEIGLIRPLSHHFCHKCNRLRLTASGQLRACLLSDHQEDIRTPLKQGCSDRELADIFLKAVRLKPFRHNLAAERSQRVSTQMSAIGG
ncbi:MAG: GTP 3',8-cyclase MoaA [Deltaproteobacteria bacterium]|nr:MAG: GTP 3',8-cyclase MoaA [Deltaproteobacteria bacterium]